MLGRMYCCPVVMLMLTSLVGLSGVLASSPSYKEMDPLLQEEYCKNFTYGFPQQQEFTSPGYPKQDYPPGIRCSRTISADYGYFVRLDFRDLFHIEPPTNDENCEYDYLEIRDGEQGYSPLIGKYCGDKFPPIITSSGRSLWIRFVSDGTIQYQGFKAVYTFIANPMETLPFIPKCEFEIGGSQDFIGTKNISQEQKDFSRKYSTPLDCTWIIRGEQGKVIWLQFFHYELKEPNDCNFNFIQVFDGKTDIEHMKNNFCGSMAESVTSQSDVVYVRFYADQRGLESEFLAAFTSIRTLGDGETCPADEYDCEDLTCIIPDLMCNGVRNCKFGWDEESCGSKTASIKLDFTATHVILILIILILIMTGMCTGMIYNLWRKLTEDKEDIIASREKSLASLAHGGSLPDIPSPTKSRTSRATSNTDCNGCYVPPPPDGGFPFGSKF